MKKQFIALAIAVAPALSHAAFSAGNSVEVTYLYPDTSTLYGSSATVTGPTDTLTNFVSFLDIVFTDNSVTLTTTRNAGINNVAFDGVRLVDQNQTLSFAGYVLNPGLTTYAGFNASRVTYGTDTIFLNVANLPGLQGQTIVLSAVPEPETYALLMAGLGVIGFLGKRRGQR